MSYLFLGKKAKKKKLKAVPLTEFLAKDENGPSITHSPVFSARSTNWADESEGLSTEGTRIFVFLFVILVVMKN